MLLELVDMQLAHIGYLLLLRDASCNGVEMNDSFNVVKVLAQTWMHAKVSAVAYIVT